MSDATTSQATVATPSVTAPDLNTFARLDILGLEVIGQQFWPDSAVMFCTPTTVEDRCPYGQRGQGYDTLVRRFTHVPVGRKATWLARAGAALPVCRVSLGVALLAHGGRLTPARN